jgi:hypothetical protein
MSLAIQIDFYEGERVITLASGLAILIVHKNQQPAKAIELEERCSKCHQHLRTWPLEPTRQSALHPHVGRPAFFVSVALV